MTDFTVTVDEDMLDVLQAMAKLQGTNVEEVLRDDFTPDSDMDVLVEFEPEARVSRLDMAAMEIELGELMGRAVALRTPEELSRCFRQQVVEGAIAV